MQGCCNTQGKKSDNDFICRDEEKQFKQKLLEDKLRDDSKLNDLREKLKEMTEQRMKLSAELAFDVPRNDASFTEKLIRQVYFHSFAVTNTYFFNYLMVMDDDLPNL